MRAIAASAVLVWHAKDQTPTGAAGVDLFFVISGFIIGKVAVGRTAPEFLADRLWRVFPPYWFAAIPWFLVAWWSGALAIDRILSSVTLWPWYGAFAEPYLRPAWTLTFEMLFYVAASLAIATGGPRLVVSLALALVGLNLAGAESVLSFIGSPLIIEFLLGLAVGRLTHSKPVALLLLPIAIGLLWAAPAPTFAATPLSDLNSVAASRVIFWGLPAAIIVYSALSFEHLFGKWADIPVFLGDASYALYLTHFTTLQFTKSILVCLFVGAAFHLLVERPLLKMRRRLQARPHGEGATITMA